MAEQKKTVRANVPVRDYDIELKIDTLNISDDLIEVSIATSVLAPYQSITLKLGLDPTDTIQEKIFGGGHINLTIKQLGQKGAPNEFLQFHLLPLNSDITMMPKKSKHQGYSPKMRQPVTIICIPIDAYRISRRTVNQIFINKRMSGIVKALIQSTGGKCDINEKTATTVINQCLIPPVSLYNAIKHLDSTFGIYDYGSGVSGYCDYKGTVHCFDFTSANKQTSSFIIEQVSPFKDSELHNKLKSGFTKDKTFYCWHPIESQYDAGSKCGVAGYNIKMIAKPINKLFAKVEDTFDNVCKYDGINDKGTSTFIHPAIKEVSDNYIIGRIGYDEDGSGLPSATRTSISGLSEYNVILERNVVMDPLMDVGKSVELKSQTLDYVSLHGRMILKSSLIIFSKDVIWKCGASLNLIRTNRTN